MTPERSEAGEIRGRVQRPPHLKEVGVAHFHIKKPWKSDSPRKKGSKTAQASKSILLSDVNKDEFSGTVHLESGDVQMYHGLAHLPNDARGSDIVDEYLETQALDPRNVAVNRSRPTRWRDPIHRNFFGGWPEMPWKSEDA